MTRASGARIPVLLVAALLASPAPAAPAAPVVTAGEPVRTVFAAPRDACDGDDTPDAPVRAFRTAEGPVRLFGLHMKNRSLTGPDLAHLAIDCAPALESRHDPDPAAYDDASWITATWTADGRTVTALIHHEYQASEHPGRCRFADYMRCWYNTVLGARSTDGGARFRRAPEPVVAAAPFPQDVGQGRHRGFFNPSNIVAEGGRAFMLAATTGWDGQPDGTCLFRNPDPADPTGWRAFDGRGFTIRYADPYRSRALPEAPCKPVGPFPGPVGSLTKLRGSGEWLAVFQAKADAGRFPVPGFYAAASRDLVDWSEPRLVLPGATLYDDPCGSGGRLIAYPSVLDPADPSRNFDRAGSTPELFYTELAVEGCTVSGPRSLLRRPLRIGMRP